MWKLALGVCLGLFLFAIACSAILGSAVHKATTQKEAIVRVEAADDVCWAGAIGDATREGCGTKSFPVRTVAGNLVAANAQKKSADSQPLAVVILIDGREVARNSTSAAYGLAQATSSL